MKSLPFVQILFLLLFSQSMIANSCASKHGVFDTKYSLKVLNEKSIYITSDNQEEAYLILLFENSKFDFSKIEDKSFNLNYQKNFC